MRAARIHSWGTSPRIDEIDRPVPGEGEVLVRMQAAGLSHLDLTVATGTFGLKPPLPYVGGIEGSGVVVEGAGPPPGTQVLLRGGGLGLLRNGTWSEYVTAPAKALTALTSPLDPAVAATFFQPLSTAYVALHDVARIGPDDHVVVVGAAGAVGSQVVQQALRAGAEVTAVVRRPDQAARVRGGVPVVLLGDDAAGARLTAERPASVLVDTIGGSALAARVRWVRPGGRAVLIGYLAGTSVELDLPSWLLDDVALLPVNMIRSEGRARAVSGELMALLAAGDLVLDVETFALDDAPEGLARLAAGQVYGRAAVRFDQPDGA